MKIKAKVVGISGRGMLAFIPEGKPQAWLAYDEFEGDQAKKQKYTTAPYITEIEVTDAKAKEIGWAEASE